MGSFINPVNVSFKDGVYQPGAQLFFYQAGTSTPLDTYSDSALSSANSNPVEANGKGQFGAIYMKRNQKYKIVLKDSDDNIIYTRDNQSAVTLDEHVYLRLLQIASDPLSQGATADGQTDDQTALQAAIDEAETNGTYVVDLLGKSYACNSQLTLHADLKIINGTINGSSRTGAESLIYAAGSRATAVNIDADVSIGDSQLTSATQSPALGRDAYCLLGDSADFDASGNIGHGIMTRLSQPAVSSGTTVYLNERSPMGFATGSSARIQKLTMLEGLVFEDVHFRDYHSKIYALIELDTCSRVRFKNCTFRNLGNYSVDEGCLEIKACAEVLIENCDWYNGDSSGVGLFIGECSRNVTVRNCTFTEIPTAIKLGGQPSGGFEGCVRDIVIDGCEFQDSATTNISGTVGCFNATIQNCRFANDSTAGPSAIIYQGAGLRVKDCDFHHIPDYSIRYDCDVDETTGDVKYFGFDCVGNTIYGGAEVNESISFETAGSSQGAFRYVNIEGNKILESKGKGIIFEGGDIESVSISNNTIKNPADTGILLEAGDLTYVDMAFNKIIGAATYCVRTQCNMDSMTVTGGYYGRDDDASHNFWLNAGAVTNVTFQGVNFNNGSYGITAVMTPTVLQHVACTFTGMASGQTSGAFTAVTGHGATGSSGTLQEA